MPSPPPSADGAPPAAYFEVFGRNDGAKEQTGDVPAGAVITGGVVIGRGTTRSNTSVLAGPTAAEIAAKVQAASTGAAPSSSVQARLAARRGGGAPAAPVASVHAPAPAPAPVSAPAPVPAASADDLFGLSLPTTGASAPAARRPSNVPEVSSARRPSGAELSFDAPHAPAPAPTHGMDDAFSMLSMAPAHAPAPSKGSSSDLEDLFSPPTHTPSASTGSGTPHSTVNLSSLYGAPAPAPQYGGYPQQGGYPYGGAPGGFPPAGAHSYGPSGGFPPTGAAPYGAPAGAPYGAPAGAPYGAGGFPPGGYASPHPGMPSSSPPAPAPQKDLFGDLFSM
jgi:hypothetical protein